jgi:FAD/FMN-containing dehydrogenase
LATVARKSDPIAALVAVCGTDAVSTDIDRRTFYAHDVGGVGAIPLAVVRPSTREVAAAAIGCATVHGLAVFPRGGGMSYTDAYLPTTTDSILLDTGALDAIVEIDARGLWATVEAGCTWAKLDAALALHGVRAAFWGPFSGHDATVGGSMSNGTVTFGSSTAGASGSNVLGFEVALADGRTIRTGMDAQPDHLPFFDQYGPNLTGLFANDCGALGIKLAVTLPLVPRTEHIGGLSFVFPDFATLARALEAVARAGLVTEALAMDPVVTEQFSGPPDLGADLKMLGQIARGRGGISRAIRAATGGRAFLKRPGFHAHFIAEGRNARDLSLRLGDIRALTGEGAEIPNTAPSAIRAVPFSPLPVTDPKGRRVLPIHGIIPYAAAQGLHAAIMAIAERHAAAATEARLVVATSFFAVGSNALLYEPVFYWEDELSPYQLAKTVAEARYADNPAARALVREMSDAMIEAMYAHGAAHLQIGRRYPYARDRDLTLLRAVKAAVDPRNLINPGVLGL